MRRAVLFLLATACVEPQLVWAPEASVPIHPSLELGCIWAASTETGTRVGGFRGAADGSAPVLFQSEGLGVGEATPDDEGRFGIELVGEPKVIEVGRAGEPVVSFRVRDPAVARVAALAPAFGFDVLTPNDLVIPKRDARAIGLLVRSGDNAVSAIDLDSGAFVGTGWRGEAKANPWFVAPIDPEGHRAVVSGYGLDRVYVLELGDPLVAIAELMPPAVVVLPEPYALLEPRDVDGDQIPEATVSAFKPRTPQAVLVHGDRIYAGFTGILSARTSAQGPVQLPAVLVSWSATDLTEPPSAWVLPFHSPQELRALDEGRVLIVSSGILDPRGDRVDVRTPGGLTIFDPEARAISEVIDLEAFGPGTAILADGVFWVGSLARPVVRRIDRATGVSRDLVLNDDAVDSVFRMAELDCGLLAVPSFNSDRLHLIDLSTGELDPLPFGGPIAVGPGRPVFEGLQIVARRPGRMGIDFVGPDLYALAGLSGRITPVELRKMLGP